MSRHRRRDETLAPWLTMAFVLAAWWLGAWAIDRGVTGDAATAASGATGAAGAAGAPGAAAAAADAGVASDAEAAGLAKRRAADEVRRASGAHDPTGLRGTLVMPVAGVEPDELRPSFNEARGERRHEAIDILAPRGTAVLAVQTGRIARLFTSAAGGLTIYQFDPTERYCFYYAHLDGYVPELTEGQVVSQGQVIGYVGTTGNAPPDTPHLHFAIFRLGPERLWWEGEPIDPFPVLR